LARERGLRTIADDAGGARVGPAVFDQPRTLELGVDVGTTGLDKYGTVGPRLGLLAGRRELVSRIRSRAFGLGLEARPMLYPAVVRSLGQYRPERVRELVATTKRIGAELKRRLGDRIRETDVIVELPAESILEEAMARAGLSHTPVVPYEATAALAMLLLRESGILTVHFAGMPPGTSALLIKFVPPETLERFGGAERFAGVVDDCLTRLAEVIGDGEAMWGLLFGSRPH
jgi:L-seryl-tRNA(Ser) seleniumtransferase